MSWDSMKQRCYNKNAKRFENYGGRGIIVCDEWINSFPQFLKDVGDKPSKIHSLERIDVNSNYESGNIRWATPQEQGKNKTNTPHICKTCGQKVYRRSVNI